MNKPFTKGEVYLSNYFVFGLAGTGKDTFAALMEKHYGVDCLALADSIRREYVTFMGRNDHKQNRQMMINIGEAYKKLYGQDVWCKATEQSFTWFSDRLIKDGRYAHEYDYFVNKRGYVPVRLTADDDVRFERLKRRDGNTQSQSLEFEKQNFIPDDYYAINIDTNGNVDQLEDTVRELFK